MSTAAPPRRLPAVLLTTARTVVRDHVLHFLKEAQEQDPNVLGFYQRAGDLVRLVPSPPPPPKAAIKRPAGAPSIGVLGKATLATELTRLMRFERLLRVNQDGREVTEPAHPPPWLIDTLVEHRVWPVPQLTGVVEAPVMLPSGEVLQTPGYHADSGLFFKPQPGAEFAPVEADPTRVQIEWARALLHEAIYDFPIPSRAGRSAWMAGLLSYFARFMYAGPTPLFMVDGTVRGAGKGKLVTLAARICLGRDPMTRTQPADDDEEDRLITAVAMGGEMFVFIDNIARPFGSALLDSTLTKTTWDAVLLYRNDSVTYDLLAIWWGCGNNVQIRKGADTVRRMLKIRIESELAHPEERRDFLHPDLLGWADEHRGRLVWAALTLLRGWVAAGRPDQDLPSFGSFEAWSAVVRNALVWAGEADPYEAAARHDQEADPAVEALGELLRGWRDLCAAFNVEGFTVQEALTKLQAELDERRLSKKADFEGLIGALGELCPGKGASRLPDASALGYTLRKYRGRVVDGLKLESSQPSGHHASRLWLVRRGSAS